jgi:hypothetical protein
MDRIDDLIAPAVRLLSASPRELRELAGRDADFRDMCHELRDAETALSAVATLPGALHEERRAECLGWIDRLKHEMARTLALSRVVPLPRPGRPRISDGPDL